MTCSHVSSCQELWKSIQNLGKPLLVHLSFGFHYNIRLRDFWEDISTEQKTLPQNTALLISPSPVTLIPALFVDGGKAQPPGGTKLRHG